MVVNSFKKEDYISEKKNLTHTKGGLKDYIFISMDVFLKILKRPRCIKAKIINNILNAADKIITDSSSSDVLINNDINNSNITNNNIIDDKLLQLLKENLNTEEEKLFVNQFNLYLKYGDDNNKYIVDFDDIWQWLGYATKQKLKNILIDNFTLNKDYINKKSKEIQLTHSDKLKKSNNYDPYFLNIDTFKELCLLANTPKAKRVRSYYLKMEKINNIYLKELLQELQNNTKKLLTIKDVTYTPNISTIQIPFKDIIDIDQSGIYIVRYGSKMMYNHININNYPNALILGYGKTNNLPKRLQDYIQERGENTVILDYIVTSHYDKYEKYFESYLKVNKRIIKGCIIDKSGNLSSTINREQFYITNIEDYNNIIEILKSLVNSKKNLDQQDKMIVLRNIDLKLEQEKTKQLQLQLEILKINYLS